MCSNVLCLICIIYGYFFAFFVKVSVVNLLFIQKQ